MNNQENIENDKKIESETSLIDELSNQESANSTDAEELIARIKARQKEEKSNKIKTIIATAVGTAILGTAIVGGGSAVKQYLEDKKQKEEQISSSDVTEAPSSGTTPNVEEPTAQVSTENTTTEQKSTEKKTTEKQTTEKATEKSTTEKKTTEKQTTEKSTESELEYETHLNSEGKPVDEYENEIYTDQYGFHYIIDDANWRLYMDLSFEDLMNTFAKDNLLYYDNTENSRRFFESEDGKLIVSIDGYEARTELNVNPAEYYDNFGEAIKILEEEKTTSEPTTEKQTTEKTTEETTTEKTTASPHMRQVEDDTNIFIPVEPAW